MRIGDITWEQKAQAIEKLVGWYGFNVKFRGPGDWYLEVPVGVAENGIVSYGAGDGPTPQAAIENWWIRYVHELDPKAYLVVERDGGKSWRGRWNGFMWEEKP